LRQETHVTDEVTVYRNVQVSDRMTPKRGDPPRWNGSHAETAALDSALLGAHSRDARWS
jgi:hypothetical protein